MIITVRLCVFVLFVEMFLILLNICVLSNLLTILWWSYLICFHMMYVLSAQHEKRGIRYGLNRWTTLYYGIGSTDSEQRRKEEGKRERARERAISFLWSFLPALLVGCSSSRADRTVPQLMKRWLQNRKYEKTVVYNKEFYHFQLIITVLAKITYILKTPNGSLTNLYLSRLDKWI